MIINRVPVITNCLDRNEADHQRALRDQREQLNRLHDVQLRRMRRDHEDDLRRVRAEAR